MTERSQAHRSLDGGFQMRTTASREARWWGKLKRQKEGNGVS